jgi:predicted RNA-binding Zn-ribbon protein involved in translation (DUF1610 family)
MGSGEVGSKAVGVTCAECGTRIVVMPPSVYEAIETIGGVDAELEFTETVAADHAQTGDRLAVADRQGWYACPACETRAQLPPDVRGLFGDTYDVAEG